MFTAIGYGRLCMTTLGLTGTLAPTSLLPTLSLSTPAGQQPLQTLAVLNLSLLSANFAHRSRH